jgi:hypothetical protein
MPVAFPSHQGLILPLWRRFPERFEGVSLAVGAAMPDVVDTLVWPLRGGELGQWAGHSLVGVVFASVPLGLGVTWLVRRFVPRRFLARLEDDHAAPTTLARASVSLLVGALSHVFFDLITHCHFWVLWPFDVSDEVFPAWWCRAWTTIPLPVYRQPYPLAPHTIVWAIVSLLGIYLFFRCLKPKR